jgi:hypothetical protein
VIEHLDLYEAGDFADFAGHPEISVVGPQEGRLRELTMMVFP